MNENHNITFFKFIFNNSLQPDLDAKFNYKAFLTKNHDTYKHRNTTYIEIVNGNDLQASIFSGCFITNKMNWIFYMPRLTKYNKDEDIEKNEIFVEFFRNLKNDINNNNDDNDINDINNIATVHTVLANMYESLPKHKDEKMNLIFTFFKLFLTNCKPNLIDLNVSPTLCYLSSKLSINNEEKCGKNQDIFKNCKNKYTIFLNELDVNDKLILITFWNKFTNLIVKESYDFLCDKFTFYYNNKETNNILSKTTFNENMKNSAINLIKRCRVDNNCNFIYSNLGKTFFDNIVIPFQQNDKSTIKLLSVIL